MQGFPRICQESPKKFGLFCLAFGCFLSVRQAGGKMPIFYKFVLDGYRQIGLFIRMGGEG